VYSMAMAAANMDYKGNLCTTPQLRSPWS
jgi:hypothetical protein